MPTTQAGEWRRFFDAQAERYDENPFTRHTVAEVDFFLSLFAIAPGARLLDVGCGTGRHVIELARRGFRVAGLDYSERMLAVARAKADAEGLAIDWVLANATEWHASTPFDAAICLCEGAFGIVENGEDAEAHDAAILRNIAASLRSGAPFLLTALNGYSIIRQMKDEHTAEGRFDPARMLANYVDEWELPEGTRTMRVYERLFIPPEVVRMLGESGFVVENVFGGTVGHWAQRPLSLDEVEAMYVCRKR